MRRPLAVLGALSIAISGWAAVLLGTAAPASAAWNQPVFERSIGGSGLAGVYAWGLQYNPVTDEILVGDYFNFNVRRFDRNGNQLGAFGRPATERSGQPYSLAVDPRDGSVYVPEIGDGQPRGYIAKYDKDGKFLYEFNSGAKYYAWIATDKNGSLYIADSHYWNNAGDPPKIRKYAVNDGTKSVSQVASFGSFGTGAGQLNMVRGITVADNGDIYVADGGNNVVTHFTNSGQYVRTITGPFGGDLRGITLDEANDTLWVVDADGGNFEKFKLSTGQHVKSYGSTGEGNGQFADGGRQLDVTPNGDVWVADYGNFRIQRFTSAGAFVGDYPNPATQPAPGLLSKVRDVAVAPDGGILIADTWNHRFQKFSADGTAVGSWGRRSSKAPYGMNYPRGIGVNPFNGDVWVANTRDHTLRVYDSSMNYRFQVGTGEDTTSTGAVRWPLDVDFYTDSSGNSVALVADYIGDRVKAFSATTGAELWSLNSSATNQVHGIAADPVGDRLYIVGPVRDRIDVYRLSTRAYVGSIGSAGTTAGRFSSPWDIELDNGNLYVSDVARNKVVVYTTSGSYQGELGATGNGPGQFRSPSGMDISQGRLYVADSSNFRVQVFALSGSQSNNHTAPALTIDAPAKGSTVPSGPVELSGTATDPDGIASVEVSVRDETTGKVWDVNSSSWATGGRWPVAALKGGDRTSMTWRWTFLAGIEGRRYTVRVRGYDAAGNLSVAPFVSSSFTVSNAAPDTQTPVATLTEPVKNQVYTDRPAVISGTATDDVGLSAVQVAVKDRANNQWWNAGTGAWGGQVWHDSVLTAPGSTSSGWSYSFDDSANEGSGGYYVAVRAKDTSNKLQPSFGLQFNVDDSPAPPPDLEAPQATLTSPVLNGAYSVPVTVTGTATDDRGVAVVQVAVKDRNKATDQWWNPLTGAWGPIKWTDAMLTQTGGASTGWSWVFDDRPVPGTGDYFVQVRAKDTAAKLSPTINTKFSAG